MTRSRLDKFYVVRSPMGRFDLALIMTLLLLIIIKPNVWYIEICISILGISGLAVRKWRRTSSFWLIVFALLLFECFLLWYRQDNHKYLISYWCLATGVAITSNSPARIGFHSAKTLVGLCFLCAVIAKLTSHSYCNNTFFETTLQTDPRFQSLVTNVVGIDESLLQENRSLIEKMDSKDGPTSTFIELEKSKKLTMFSWVMTIWTIIIEVLIAITFLTKLGKRYRNYLLVAFIASTYAVANVIGFGWILSVMGIAQLEDDEKHFAIVFFIMILILHVYRIPFSFLLF